MRTVRVEGASARVYSLPDQLLQGQVVPELTWNNWRMLPPGDWGSNINDYVFADGAIVVGMNSRGMGPAETFDPVSPPGWNEAAPGGTFVKIGVGVLRKPGDGKPYSQFRAYQIVDGGTWSVKSSGRRVEFVIVRQVLARKSS